jgi:PST family polysaccharide transporter
MQKSVDRWLSNFCENCFRIIQNFNILAVGFFAGTAAVGVYSIAEKILRSAQMVQNVIGDALYPSFAKGFVGDPAFFKKTATTYKWHIIIIYTVASVALFMLSNFIGQVIGRTSAEEVTACLKIMSAAFLFGGLNYVCAILGMTTCGYSKQFSWCVIATGLFNILCATSLSYLYSYYGASLALTLSELFLLCRCFLFKKDWYFMISFTTVLVTYANRGACYTRLYLR